MSVGEDKKMSVEVLESEKIIKIAENTAVFKSLVLTGQLLALLIGLETNTWWIAVMGLFLLNLVLIFNRINNVEIKRGLVLSTIIIGFLLHFPYIGIVRSQIPIIVNWFPVGEEFPEIFSMLIIVAGILVVIGGIEGLRATKEMREVFKYHYIIK